MIIKKKSLILPVLSECTHVEYNSAPLIIRVDDITYIKSAWTQGSEINSIWTGAVVYRILFNND